MNSSISLSKWDVNKALSLTPLEGKSLSVETDQEQLLLIGKGFVPLLDLKVGLKVQPPTPNGLVSVQWKILKPKPASFSLAASIAAAILREKIGSLPALKDAVVEVTDEHILLDPARLRFGALTLGDHAQILSLTLAPPSGAAVELTFRLN